MNALHKQTEELLVTIVRDQRDFMFISKGAADDQQPGLAAVFAKKSGCFTGFEEIITNFLESFGGKVDLKNIFKDKNLSNVTDAESALKYAVAKQQGVIKLITQLRTEATRTNDTTTMEMMDPILIKLENMVTRTKQRLELLHKLNNPAEFDQVMLVKCQENS
jgi:ferritin